MKNTSQLSLCLPPFFLLSRTIPQHFEQDPAAGLLRHRVEEPNAAPSHSNPALSPRLANSTLLLYGFPVFITTRLYKHNGGSRHLVYRMAKKESPDSPVGDGYPADPNYLFDIVGDSRLIVGTDRADIADAQPPVFAEGFRSGLGIVRVTRCARGSL